MVSLAPGGAGPRGEHPGQGGGTGGHGGDQHHPHHPPLPGPPLPRLPYETLVVPMCPHDVSCHTDSWPLTISQYSISPPAFSLSSSLLVSPAARPPSSISPGKQFRSDESFICNLNPFVVKNWSNAASGIREQFTENKCDKNKVHIQILKHLNLVLTVVSNALCFFELFNIHLKFFETVLVLTDD